MLNSDTLRQHHQREKGQTEANTGHLIKTVSLRLSCKEGMGRKQEKEEKEKMMVISENSHEKKMERRERQKVGKSICRVPGTKRSLSEKKGVR